ncbi:MAG: phage tail sheath subtilisin-like domain-containing protein [Treponema sp.]|jgi:phage tail sheath gpL-like|nr:phage tail sheath subtilisin-like domain-containing protein [Treponema sp.]
MPIPIRQIPAALLVPGHYQEIDNSLAGSQGDIKKALMIGYKLATSEAENGKPASVLSAAKAHQLFGCGSPAAIMAETFLALNKVEELHVLPIPEPEAGTAWKKQFAVSGYAADGGAVRIAVNGRNFEAAIAAGANAEAVAAAITARINAEITLPVMAEADGNVVAVLANVKGTAGNNNSVFVAPLASGVSVEETAAIAGTDVTDIKPFLKGLGEVRYNFIASDFDDAGNIRASSDELESRYGAMRQIGGRMYIALSGELGSKTDAGTMLAKAGGANSPHIVLVPRSVNPELPCVWAAAWCAAACRILADDPAANTYDTKIAGLIGGMEFDSGERQKLLEAGIATYRLDAAGSVLIERLVTSYTENADGGRDTSYLDVQVSETVDAVRTYINAEAKKRFKDWKLSGTEENFGSGAKVMSPGVFRSFLAELYSEAFIKAFQWCQDFDGYKKSIVVEIKKGSKTRLEYKHQPSLIGQFYIGAGLMQFK